MACAICPRERRSGTLILVSGGQDVCPDTRHIGAASIEARSFRNLEGQSAAKDDWVKWQ
jgi:hypothetical protein